MGRPLRKLCLIVAIIFIFGLIVLRIKTLANFIILFVSVWPIFVLYILTIVFVRWVRLVSS